MNRLLLIAWLAVCPCAASFAAVCTTPAPSGCLLGTVPGAALLRMYGGNKNRLTFKWRYGQETVPSDFGDPFAATTYAVCIYDSSGMILRNENVVGPEPCVSSGSTPCWRETKSGFRYRQIDTFGQATKIALQAGGDGKAAVKYTSRSAVVLANNGIPVALPVVVQLQASDGACWEATFSTATVNSLTAVFRATSD